MRSRAWLAVVVALAGACGDAPSSPRPDAGAGAVVQPAPKPLAALEAPRGEVLLERGGERRAAAAEPLFAGDAVETGADGAAVVRLHDGRPVELGPDGRFELDAEGAGVVLTVARGLLLTRVPAAPSAGPGQGEVRLTISTPFGLTRVGASGLTMTVGAEGAEVDVAVGELELVSKSGEVRRLSGGQQGVLGQARELPLITMAIVVAAGRAEVKKQGARAFVPVNPRRLPALAPGDTVRVREGRLALAPADSATRLGLERGTELVLREVRRGRDREDTQVELQKGAVELVAPAGQRTRVGVGQGVTLVSDLGGQYLLRKTGAGFAVDSWAGDLRVERPGEADLLVPGGSQAEVPLAGSATVVAAEPEVVRLSPRAGQRVYHQGLARVSLGWEDDGAGGPWRVEVATDGDFKRIVRDGVVHAPFITVPAPRQGTLFWRVTRGAATLGRGQAQFAPEPRAQDLSRVKNEVPDGPDTTSILFQDKPPVLTFTWAAMERAARYRVRVYREGQLASPVVERAVAETQVALPENSLGEGRYLWSVTPLDARGAELQGGRMNKLHLVYDNAVSALVIKAPRNGDPGGKTVHVVGVAPVGSRLFVNGRALALDDAHRFDAQVAPAAGGRVVFRLLHGGAETYTVRTVRRR